MLNNIMLTLQTLSSCEIVVIQEQVSLGQEVQITEETTRQDLT